MSAHQIYLSLDAAAQAALSTLEADRKMSSFSKLDSSTSGGFLTNHRDGRRLLDGPGYENVLYLTTVNSPSESEMREVT